MKGGFAKLIAEKTDFKTKATDKDGHYIMKKVKFSRKAKLF